MIKIYFFGVPQGFEIFPEGDRLVKAYYQQFYNTSITDEYRFMIRRGKNNVKYTFIKYNIISGSNRTGSLWGMSIVLQDQYFENPKPVLDFLKLAFQKLVETGKILIKADTSIKFNTVSLASNKEFLESVTEVLFKQIGSTFKNALKQIPSKSDTKFMVSSKSALLSINSSENEINNSFFQYGSVILSPSVPENSLISLEEDRELDIEKYTDLVKIIDSVKREQILVQSEIQNLQATILEFQTNSQPPSSELLVDVKSQWIDVNGRISKIVEQVNSVEKDKSIHDKNSFAQSIYKDLTLIKDSNFRQLKIIENQEKIIENRVNSQENVTVATDGSKLKPIPQKRYLLVLIFSIVIIIGLVYFAPSNRNTSQLYIDAIKNAEILMNGNDVGKLREAKGYLQMALELKPGDDFVIDKLSLLDKRINKGNDPAINSFPNQNIINGDYQIAMSKGDSNLVGIGRGQNLNKARIRFKEALKIKPGDPDALNKLRMVEEEISRLNKPRTRKPKENGPPKTTINN